MSALLDAGLTQAEIAVELGLSRPTGCFHVRALGVPARREFGRRYDWAAIAAFYAAGHSAAAARTQYGVSRAAWADAVRRGAIVPRSSLIPESELYVAGRHRCRQHVKSRLLSAGLKTRCCEQCGLTEWLGAPLSFELHHHNGDGQDNRLVNLQLLCPNCHSQTDNWGARNKGRHPIAEASSGER